MLEFEDEPEPLVTATVPGGPVLGGSWAEMAEKLKVLISPGLVRGLADEGEEFEGGA